MLSHFVPNENKDIDIQVSCTLLFEE